jgi:hypothetical protein
MCSFDFSLPQIKTTQAEACATKNIANRKRNPNHQDVFSERIHHELVSNPD